MFKPYTDRPSPEVPTPDHIERPDYIACVLLQAADLIRTYGFVRLEYGSSLRGFCALGAIRHVTKMNPARPEIERAFEHYLRARGHLRSRNRAIHHWNDAPGRTKQQVIDTLEAAAFGWKRYENIRR